MPALLYCRTGPMSGASFSLDAESTVGRAGDNTVSLSDDRISSRHARIWPDAESGHWLVEDLESRNGTLVDGAPAAEPVELGDLSVITFAGSFDFIFQVVSSSEAQAPERRPTRPDVMTRAGGASPALPNVADQERAAPDATPAPDPRTQVAGASPNLPDLGGAPEDVRTRVGGASPSLPDVNAGDDDIRTQLGGAPPSLPDMSAPGTASPEPEARADAGHSTVVLTVRTSSDDASEFELSNGEHVVGRSSDADVQIDDTSLSRRHAVLVVKNGAVSVRDDGSKNGTFIDGEKVVGERAVTAKNRLRFGFRIEAWISGEGR